MARARRALWQDAVVRGDPTQFIGSIPDHYDRGMGPVIFAGPAALAAKRVASLAPARVLETAAGTGIVTRALRDALPPSATIVATDLNGAMLDVSAKKFRPDESVTFQPADACLLPFADGAFDAVLCQFGVMFFPDKDKAYREARRVLAPGGHYVFSVWDAMRHNPFSRVTTEVLHAAFAADPPPFLNTPVGYAAIDPVKASLLAAGFEGLRLDVIRMPGPVADFSAFAGGLVRGSPLVDQIRARGETPEKIERLVEAALRREFGAAGSVPLQFMLYEARRG